MSKTVLGNWDLNEGRLKMSYYSKPQIEQLFNLINESNPGLMELRDLENTTIGIPFRRTVKPGEIQDTSIEIYANPGSFYLGKQIVHYRRINIGTLFANIVPHIERWSSGSMPRSVWMDLLNKKYGLAFVNEDLISVNHIGEGTNYINIEPTSLAYIGQLRFRWTRGKRAMDQILTKDEYTGLYWDRVYDENKPLMTSVNFNLDYTRFNNINAISNGITLNNVGSFSGDVTAIIDWYNKCSGLELDLGTVHTSPNGIKGLQMTRFTIPSTAIPEANSINYNRVLIITPTTTSWFCGKILIHYNV